MPKMASAVENQHLKTFDSETNSHVSTDSKYFFQDVGILLPPPREYYCVSFVCEDFLEPESKTPNDLNDPLQHKIPLAQSLPPPQTKEKHPDSPNEDLCALDNEVPSFMFRPISVPACEVPSPPPTDAWFQSKDTHKVIHPDFKYDCSSLDDEVAFFMSSCGVPLPPRSPPVKAFGHCGKHRSSTVLSLDDEEEHLVPKRTKLMPCDVPLPPSPPAAEKRDACLGFPEHERSELMPLNVLANIPLPPSPPPSPVTADDTDLKCTSPLTTRKHGYLSISSVNDVEEHLMPKRTRLMTCDDL